MLTITLALSFSQYLGLVLFIVKQYSQTAHASHAHPPNFLYYDTTENNSTIIPISPSLLGRGHRRKQQPKWLRDVLPEPPAPVADSLPTIALPHSNVALERSIPDVLPVSRMKSQSSVCRTESNCFGVVREFASRPSFDPDDRLTSSDLANYHRAQHPSIMPNSIPIVGTASPACWYSPFSSASVCRLMAWFWTGSARKSLDDLDTLVKNVILADDFDSKDLRDFSVKKENDKLDKIKNANTGISQPLENVMLTESTMRSNSESCSRKLEDIWREVAVKISLPDGSRYSSENDAPSFTIPGLHIRSLTAVIRSAFQSSDALRFHYTPFKSFWTPSVELSKSDQKAENKRPAAKSAGTNSKKRSREEPENLSTDSDGPSCKHGQRIYDELYSSDVWIEAHASLQRQREDAGEALEYALAGLMLWSDSTHLANFGSASLWPIYLYFGNQSKYERVRPTMNACHHLAYIPSVRLVFDVLHSAQS